MATPEAQESISRLQLMEQNLQAVGMQKQQFSTQLFEVDSALKELDKTDSAFKIVGNIMIKSDKDTLQKELSQRKEILELRITSLEKQETQIKDEAKKLQEEVMGKLKK